MTAVVAVFLAALQGISELFPVSSLGHAVIVPALLRLGVDQRAEEFLPFLVVLHLATAAALLVYFWRDWLGILLGLVVGPAQWRRDSARLLALIVMATLPAAALGFLFEKPLRLLFATPVIAACFLIGNGFMLFAGERLRDRFGGGGGDLAQLTWKGALAIGFWQCLAFLPGLSRSGSTLVGGLLAGLSHRAAAHFSFLIATPVILGAGLLEVPKLLRRGAPPEALSLSLLGAATAGVVAFASVAFLMRYFRKKELDALDPFAWYCWVAGAGSILALTLR